MVLWVQWLDARGKGSRPSPVSRSCVLSSIVQGSACVGADTTQKGPTMDGVPRKHKAYPNTQPLQTPAFLRMSSVEPILRPPRLLMPRVYQSLPLLVTSYLMPKTDTNHYQSNPPGNSKPKAANNGPATRNTSNHNSPRARFTFRIKQ